MRKDKLVKCLSLLPGISLFLICLASCERTEYDLLDPESAGIWKQYSTTNSTLPGNSIYDIDIDQTGNLWATCYGKGLAKFQSGVWTTYNISNSYILSNYTTALEPATGGMLIGTTYGLSVRQTSGTWLYYYDSSVAYMIINALKTDSRGNYWIGTEDEGYYFYNGTSFSHYLSGYDVNAIAEDKSGNIWIGTDRGLFKYNGTHLTISSTPVFSSSNGLTSNNISTLYTDSKGRLWVGYFASKTASWVENNAVNQLNLMTGEELTTIWDIQEDKKGDIWFATGGSGLIHYDGVIPHSYKEYNTSLIDDDIYCICQDLEGNLWLGTSSKGVLKYTLPLE
jgi:ligand-binding sensor domain-containing protein